MCLVLIAIDQHPHFPLIILSNRDEFYDRASARADFWQEDPTIFCGKDLVKGGSWLGVNTLGHFSLVTNYRNPKAHRPSMISRGLLVKNYLLESKNTDPLDYLEHIKSEAKQYNPFNLILGRLNQIYYYSNVTNEIKQLGSGLYGLSNHLLDTSWYKVSHAKEAFIALKEQLGHCNHPEKIRDLLLPILADKSLAPDELLPSTGVDRGIEKLLSSIFVEIPEHNYGTSSSSIIIFEKNTISFSERIIANGTLITTKISLS